MNKSLTRLVIFAALLGATVAAPAFASGRYSGRPPQPPAKSGDSMMKLDRDKYALGQKVYEGSVMTTNSGEADAQMGRLKAVQMKLPAETAQMKDLVGLAGKLSETQLEALEYYVEQRFTMKK